MTSARAWLLLLLLAILQIGLAVRFVDVMPWRKQGISNGKVLGDISAPDERAHANLLGFLLRNEPIPPLRVNDPKLSENYEVHQAPLYYHATATILKATGHDEIESDKTGRTARLVNIGFGVLNTVALFCLGLYGFGSRTLALGAAALFAFLPMWLSVTASVNNDALLCAFINGSLAAGATAHRLRSLPLWIMAGLLGGLAIWTKTSGILVLPALALMGLIATDGRGPRAGGVLALAIGLAIATPLLLKNQRLYGDVLGQKTFNEAFKSQAKAKQPTRGVIPMISFLTQLDHETQESAFGVFGYFDIRYQSDPWAWGFIWLWTMAGLGSIRLLHSPARGPTLGLLLLFSLVLAGYIAFNVVYRQPQGRYLFPGIALLMLGAAEGCRITWRPALPAMALLLAYWSFKTPAYIAPHFKVRMDAYELYLRQSVNVNQDRGGVVAPPVK